MGKRPKRKPFEEMTPEELEQATREDEVMLVKVQGAIETVQKLLDNKKLWFDLEVLALEMNDAMDDLNDAIKDIEDKLRAQQFRPAWTPMVYQKPPKHPGVKLPALKPGALIWNGKNLCWEPDDRQQPPEPILSCSKGIRMAICSHLEALYAELTRPRLIPEPEARTP